MLGLGVFRPRASAPAVIQCPWAEPLRQVPHCTTCRQWFGGGNGVPFLQPCCGSRDPATLWPCDLCDPV